MNLDEILAQVCDPNVCGVSSATRELADIVKRVRITPRERVLLQGYFAPTLAAISDEEHAMVAAIARRVWEATA